MLRQGGEALAQRKELVRISIQGSKIIQVVSGNIKHNSIRRMSIDIYILYYISKVFLVLYLIRISLNDGLLSLKAVERSSLVFEIHV